MKIPRAIYFFYFAGAACLIPYLVLYYQDLGLSGGQIGILTGIPPVMALLAAPAWGALADATHQHKRILLLTISLSAISVPIIAYMNSFAGLALIITLYAFFTVPILPLVDNSVVEQLGDRRGEYGRQRVWGSYGWGAAGLASGWIVGAFGMWIIFPLYSLMLGFGLLAARNFRVTEVSIGIHLGRNLRQLFTNRRWLLFLGLVWAAGAGLAMFHNYYFIFLKEIGTSDGLLGVALALGILSEIPFMLYSNRLLMRFKAGGLLVIACLAIVLRILICSLAISPWQALALQLLQGPTFALVLVAGVEFASQIAPPGMGATAQGIFSGIFSGLGFASGSVLGGILYQGFGIRIMYQSAAAIVFSGLVVFLMVNFWRANLIRAQAS